MKFKERIENGKQWAKEHKKEIIIGTVGGALLAVGGVKIYKIYHTPIKADKDLLYDAKLFEKFLDTVDEVKDGSKGYVPITLDEFKDMTDGIERLNCGNGAVMKIKGLIAFGDEIVE